MDRPSGEGPQSLWSQWGLLSGGLKDPFFKIRHLHGLFSGSSAGPRAGSLGSLPRLLGLSYNMVSRLPSEYVKSSTRCPFLRLGLRKGVQHPFHGILAIKSS